MYLEIRNNVAPSVIGNIPVVALVLSTRTSDLLEPNSLVREKTTYTVKVAAGRLPLRVPIATVGDLRERVLDVVVDSGGVADIHLVPGPVRIRAALVPGFSAAGDDKRGHARRVFQRDHAVDGAR